MIQRPRSSWLDAEPIRKADAPAPGSPADAPAVAGRCRGGSGLAPCHRRRRRRALRQVDRWRPLPSTSPEERRPVAPESGGTGDAGKKAGGSAPEELAESPKQPITLTATTVAVNDTGFDAMAEGKFVSYLRVSTARQGASGLGLEAQRKAVADFLAGGRWTHVREFVEVESGKRTDRPKLAEAMALCRIHGATLVIAKIDRLSRNAAFLLSLRDAGVDFVAADMPNANRLTVGIMSMVAEAERDAISARTKAALAAKARWYQEQATPEQLAELRKNGRPTQLGGSRPNSREIHRQGARASLAARQAKATGRASDLAPLIAELQASGATSLAQLAAALTERGIPTSRGADRWSPMQVSRVLKAAGGGT